MKPAIRICAALLVLVATSAQADDSLWDSLGKSTGLIAPPPNPPDFVKASRPKEEPASIPIFAAPEEPRSKVKTPAELKAMDEDLGRAAGSQASRPPAAAPRARKRAPARSSDAVAK